MFNFILVVLAIAGTVGSYALGRTLYHYVKTPLLLPITVAVFIIVTVLIVADISYETYMSGSKWIHVFLGPAVVSLAYPLYEHRELLRRLAFPILIGSLVGALVGIFSGFFLAKMSHLDEALLYSLLPKSVTTPVAMDISESLGGIAPLAAVLVIIAGLSGVLLGPLMYRIFSLRTEIGRGVGIGSASHAIGTASAFEQSELEGSISTIAMIVNAVFVSILIPVTIPFLL